MGCIMGELLLGGPVFQGQSELDQLDRIVSLLGTPTEDMWPGIKALPNHGKVVLRSMPSQLRSKFQVSLDPSLSRTIAHQGAVAGGAKWGGA